jgi:hypothetical protein
MSEGPAQQTFDWTQDSAECIEGLKFDLETQYDFVLDNFTKHNLVRKDGSKVVYKDSAKKAGQDVLMYTFAWKELSSKVIFKQDFFVQEQYRVNENAPDTEDEIVSLSRKLGYSPVLGGRFALSDFVHLGTKISAKLKVQPQTDADKAAGKKAYNTLDISTIVVDGESVPDSQQNLEDSVDGNTIEELNKIIKEKPVSKKFSELTAKISKLVAKGGDASLFEAAMVANQKGLLKF